MPGQTEIPVSGGFMGPLGRLNYNDYFPLGTTDHAESFHFDLCEDSDSDGLASKMPRNIQKASGLNSYGVVKHPKKFCQRGKPKTIEDGDSVSDEVSHTGRKLVPVISRSEAIAASNEYSSHAIGARYHIKPSKNRKCSVESAFTPVNKADSHRPEACRDEEATSSLLTTNNDRGSNGSSLSDAGSEPSSRETTPPDEPPVQPGGPRGPYGVSREEILDAAAMAGPRRERTSSPSQGGMQEPELQREHSTQSRPSRKRKAMQSRSMYATAGDPARASKRLRFSENKGEDYSTICESQPPSFGGSEENEDSPLTFRLINWKGETVHLPKGAAYIEIRKCHEL